MAPSPELDLAVGSACGKVILLGEHAVVWGAPALAAGLGRGLLARARHAGGESASTLLLAGERHYADPDGSDRVGRAWAALLGADLEGATMTAEVVGDLPAGMGLGFSATAGVALGRAVERCLGRGPTDAAVERRAMAWERVFHGNPSGIDVAAAMHGGLLRFSRTEGRRALGAPQAIELCVGLTGLGSATHEMVARVAAVRDQDRARFDRTLEDVAAMTEQAVVAIAQADGALLGALMNRAGDALASWSVSCGEIDELCQTARSAGALGAKLTGAGGGGAVLALVGFGPPNEATAPAVAALGERILAVWRAKGYDGFAARVGFRQVLPSDPPPLGVAGGAEADQAPGR